MNNDGERLIGKPVWRPAPNSSTMKTARDWIEILGLGKHPEGGYYRETYRSETTFAGPGFTGPRAVSTAIYFLLPADEVSALHRIKSDELWHFYAGQPLTIQVIAADGSATTILLSGERPQAIVKAGCWFGATVASEYALVGCTVAPGFDFHDFEMGERAALLAAYPQHRLIIERLTKPAGSG